MDIISKGDFTVTNDNGKTVFTFRYPSLECIDFVKTPYKEKPIKATDKQGRGFFYGNKSTRRRSKSFSNAAWKFYFAPF